MHLELKKNPFVRSPTLDTVLMVERAIDEYSGEYNRTELWKKLPKKVMWQTYLLILDYLVNTNRIGIDRKGKIVCRESARSAPAYAQVTRNSPGSTLVLFG